jgi:hypothetical protein
MSSTSDLRVVRSPKGRLWHLVVEAPAPAPGTVQVVCGGFLGGSRFWPLAALPASQTVCPHCLRRFGGRPR